MMAQGTLRVAVPAGTRHDIFGQLLTWQRRIALRRHLHELDDRLLDDMGMTRADADRESGKPFWVA